jgi:peptide/nickel transport system substrate-binding protein
MALDRDRVGRSGRRALLGGALGSLGLAAVTAVACRGGDSSSGPAASSGTAAPRAPGYRESAKPLTISSPPQYSKKYPNINKLLVDYHWSKSPDRLKPQKPSPGGVYKAILVYSPILDWVNADISGTGSRNSMTHSNVLNMDVGVFMKDNNSWDLSARDGLAESWEQPDNRTYVFKFRDTVKWHNKPPVNGRAFTAADVKYTWDVMGKTGVHVPLFSRVDRIESPDARTLRVTMKQPYAPFLKLVSTPQTAIFAREQWESSDGLTKESIGTGPFIMKKHEPNVEAVYVRNPEFFLKDDDGRQLPYLDAVHDIRTLTDTEAQKAAFLANQIDYYRPGSPPLFEDARRQKPDAFAQALPNYPHVNHSLHPSARNPVLQDVRVRRALSLALDRVNTYTDTVWFGGATPNDYLPYIYMGQEWPDHWDKMGSWLKYDPQQAKQLLAAAGYPNGLRLEFLTGTLPIQTVWTQGAQSDLKEIGVELDLRPTEPTALATAWNKKEWKDLHAATELSLKPVEIDAWFDFYLSTSPTNFIGYKDSRIDDLGEQQRRELDEQKRLAILKEARDYLRDQVPTIIQGYNYQFAMFQSYTHDLIDSQIQLSSGWGALQYTRAWMDERAPKREIPG